MDTNLRNENKTKYSDLAGKTILITGSTGLIGSNLIKTLLNQQRSLIKPVKIIAFARDEEKAKKIFGTDYDKIQWFIGDIETPIILRENVNYIVHAASQTSSKAFVDRPVETIKTAIAGTVNMLQLAKDKKVEKFLYLSTMEVYGTPITDEKINETHSTNLNTLSIRSCYPESKRLCENLCISYMGEYGVPVNIIRLTQTFGPGVAYNDGRVFADFARCVIENRDIVLHTKGETKRNYLYTEDAINAILIVLLYGKNGEAYNAANESTYCSIAEMAYMVANRCANASIKVKIEDNAENNFGFAPTLRMNLDTSKLEYLGWKATTGLKVMFDNLIEDMRINKNSK